MTNNFSDVEQRVKRYWYTDGIVEIIGGGLSILIGTYTIIQKLVPDGSIWSTILGGLYVFLMVGGVFITRWLVTNLKTRITYPRTGYVDYHSQKQTGWRRLLTVGIAFGVSALLIIFGKLFWLTSIDLQLEDDMEAILPYTRTNGGATPGRWSSPESR